MEINKILSWIEVANDEVTTLHTYTSKLETVGNDEKLLEIMADEVNHALIALLTASKELGLKVPEDGIEKALSGVFGGEEQ